MKNEIKPLYDELDTGIPLEVLAAKFCVSNDPYKSAKKASPELLNNAFTAKHKTLFQHRHVTVEINTSAFVEFFLIQYQYINFSIRSRRYIKHSSNNENAAEYYEFYKRMIDEGVSLETARYILPIKYVESHMLATASLYEWLNIYYDFTYGKYSLIGKELHEFAETLKNYLIKEIVHTELHFLFEFDIIASHFGGSDFRHYLNNLDEYSKGVSPVESLYCNINQVMNDYVQLHNSPIDVKNTFNYIVHNAVHSFACATHVLRHRTVGRNFNGFSINKFIVPSELIYGLAKFYDEYLHLQIQSNEITMGSVVYCSYVFGHESLLNFIKQRHCIKAMPETVFFAKKLIDLAKNTGNAIFNTYYGKDLFNNCPCKELANGCQTVKIVKPHDVVSVNP